MARQATTFVNPYTFIPLTKRTSIAGLTAQDDSPAPLTGVIRCTLEAMRPIAIPGSQPEDDGSAIPFFKISDEPAIPGSSLRGCIRSVFETVTSSCVRTNSEYLHSTSGLKRPGLLTKRKDGSYELFDATRYRVKKAGLSRNLKTGDQIRFSGKTGRRNGAAGTVTDIGPQYRSTGWFLHVNTIDTGKANHPSVFERGKSLGTVDARYVDVALRENIAQYNKRDDESKRLVRGSEENDVPKNVYAHEYEEAFSRMTRGEGMLPVWYGVQTGKGIKSYQFSWAQVSRSVYPISPQHLVAEKHLLPCTDEEHACPACSLFGFVPSTGNEGSARASRVRFSDALLTQTSPHGFLKDKDGLDPYLPPLMEPRQSAFEMYLRNATYPHSFTPESEGTELAGRKAYWHHQGVVRWGESKTTESGQQLTKRIEVLDKGATFGFDVYVDGVTKEQLNTLLWSLTFGQYWTGGDKYWHLIGHGKPIGLGSVRVSINNVSIRTVDDQGYHILDSKTLMMDLAKVENLLDTSSVRAIKCVADHTAIPASSDISYPAITPGGDIFEWFSANRQSFNRNTNLPLYGTSLPSIDSPKQTLSRNPPTPGPSGRAKLPRPRAKTDDSSLSAGVQTTKDSVKTPASSTPRYEGTICNMSTRKSDIAIGRVSWGTGKELFCHIRFSPSINPDEWKRRFKRGTKITFEVQPNPNGKDDVAANIEFQ